MLRKGARTDVGGDESKIVEPYTNFTELYKKYCQTQRGITWEKFCKMRFFEIKSNIDGYSEDFVANGSLTELQTKYIVGMFSKSANEINWFNKKEENNINLTDKEMEIAKQASEVFRKKRGQLIN